MAANIVAILGNFNIVGSAIGISIGMAANEVLKSMADGIIMPLLSVFIKRGELENKVIRLGHANLRVGELISNIIYFILVILIVLFVLKFVMGGLIAQIIENKDAMKKQSIQYDRQSAGHLRAIRNYNVPL
jgi:large-conductance mechanosensitive channel